MRDQKQNKKFIRDKKVKKIIGNKKMIIKAPNLYPKVIKGVGRLTSETQPKVEFSYQVVVNGRVFEVNGVMK